MDGIDLIRCTLQPRQAGPNGQHRHPDWEFHLVVQGTGSFVANRRRLAFRGGTTWYTRPQAPHRVEQVDDGVFLQYVVWARLPAALARMVGRGWGEMVPFAAGSGDDGLFWSIQEDLRRDAPHARAAACHRFAAWLHGVLDRRTTPPSSDPPSLAAMHRFMLENGDRQLRLAEVARAAGVSPAYAVRLFRRHHGSPPLAWHRQRRLEAASRWLAGSDLPIHEVASLTGFADPLHFSRAFRAWCGQSPLAWRRSRA